MLAKSGAVQLSPENKALLKGQSFVRVERVQEMLEQAQSMLVQTAPDLRATMKLYIESPVARSILLKPILQEVSLAKKKMECVISSCIDPGQPKRDLESLLQNVSYAILSELSQ
jgi:hypothetical protein